MAFLSSFQGSLTATAATAYAAAEKQLFMQG